MTDLSNQSAPPTALPATAQAPSKPMLETQVAPPKGRPGLPESPVQRGVRNMMQGIFGDGEILGNNEDLSDQPNPPQEKISTVSGLIDAVSSPRARPEEPNSSSSLFDNGQDTHQEEPTQHPQHQEDDDSGEQEDPKEFNFKKLRRAANESKNLLQQREQEIADLKAKIEKYDKGEEVPQALSDKLSQLQNYERLVAWKSSEERETKYIKPLEALTTSLNGYLEDYGMSEETADEILSLGSQAELNNYLSKKFDSVGALEVKSLVAKIKNTQRDLANADKSPEDSLKALIEETRTQREVRRAQSREKINTTAERAWTRALSKIKEEGKAKELIYREGDEEFNKKWVEPHLAKSAKDYGQIVRMLADNGLEELPEDLSYALSRMVLLATASATSIESRNVAMSHAENLENSSRRDARYIRPSIGGSTPSIGRESNGYQTNSLKDGINNILSEVLGSRR